MDVTVSQNPDVKLNGSVDFPAQTMRQVFQEATMQVTKQAVEPVVDLIADSEKRLEEKFDTTNNNMATQFVEQEKKIGKMLAGMK